MTLTGLLPFIIIAAIAVPAFAVIFGKMGWSRAWALIAALPPGIFIVLWVVALKLPALREEEIERIFGGDGPKFRRDSDHP